MNLGTGGIGGTGRKKRTTYQTAENTTGISVPSGSATLVSTTLLNAPPGLYFVHARTFVMNNVAGAGLTLTVGGITAAQLDARYSAGPLNLMCLYVHSVQAHLSASLGASFESGTATYGATGDGRFSHRIIIFRIGDY